MNTPRNYDEALARIARLETALRQIASFREGQVVTSSFDDPASAKIAREALGARAFEIPTKEVTGETL